ncbi:MAG: 30S ribosomal protein S6e [Candidatus Ranarchaeia archaeon]|jgi:small subunit ribosomal protein S6e
MPVFKLVISDPKSGKSERLELKDEKTRPLIGRKLGEEIQGEIVGVSGAYLRITGGSDKDGFPMRPDIHGGVRKRSLVRGGIGFHPKIKGQKKRRILRGNTITEDIVQINLVRIPELTHKPSEEIKKKVAPKKAPTPKKATPLKETKKKTTKKASTPKKATPPKETKKKTTKKAPTKKTSAKTAKPKKK